MVRAPLLVAALVAPVLLAGCGSAPMPEKDVEERASVEIGKQIGQAPVVDCPGDLRSREGATMTCTLADPNGSDETYTMTVSVVSLQDGVAHLDFALDERRPQR